MQSNRDKQRNRDRKIIEFIEDFTVARTSTLLELFFSNVSKTAGYRRLQKLVEYGEIERQRFYVNDEYIYYISNNKPKQVKHRLALTDLYCRLHQVEGLEIVEFQNEFSLFPTLRADGFIAYTYQNNNYIAFIETELSNKPNIQKYEELYNSNEWKEFFPVFPLVIFVTNKRISKTDLPVIRIKEDLSNITDLI